MARSENLAPHLPYLRRYARAVTGCQDTGDRYVRATLTALLSEKAELAPSLTPRVALYRLFHGIWSDQVNRDTQASLNFDLSAGEARLRGLVTSRLPALLLTAVEGFSIAEAGQILQQDPQGVEHAIGEAQHAIEKDLTSRVLIIEDEALIALHLENIVRELGHEVAGKASSQAEAVMLAQAEQPGLILADINLGTGGSGLDAVVEILQTFSVPVIFVTAYPECLLTGDRPEPAYLVTKPFLPVTLQATIGQALFCHQLRSPTVLAPGAPRTGTQQPETAQPETPTNIVAFA